MAKKILSDPKFVQTHTTVTPAAANVAKALCKRDEVETVRPGIIKNSRSTCPRLKLRVINGGLEVTVIGRSSIQILLVQTADVNSTWEFLDEFTVEGQ